MNAFENNGQILYYCYDEDRVIQFITDNMYQIFTKYNLADMRDIPLENAVISERGNGDELFDNRTMEYWKVAKVKQLKDKYKVLFSQSLPTSVDEISVSVDDINIGNLLIKKCIAEETNDNVYFEDYNKDIKNVTKDNIKIIFKEAAIANMNYHKDYRTIEILINQAETVEDLQAIVI